MSTAGTIVDDRDPRIEYEGAWNNGGVPVEFQGTTKYATQAGATASFTFVGRSIAVYGSVSVEHPAIASMSFVIDNSTTGSYTPPDDIDAALTRAVLWSSPSMTEGSHKLVITQTKANGQGQIYLDYLLFQTALAASDPASSSGSASLSTPASSGATGSSNSGSSGAAGPPGASSSTGNPAIQGTHPGTSGILTGASASSGSSTPLGASAPTDGVASNPISSSASSQTVPPKSTPTVTIVAAVLGALLLLVIGGVAVSYLRRRHCGGPQPEAGELRQARGGMRTVSPFVLSGATTPSTALASPSAKHGGPALRSHHPSASQSSGVDVIRPLSALRRSNLAGEATRPGAPSIGGSLRTDGEDAPPEYTA
ncbi:hypothetical protein MVEN_01608400 [Mycena venus]|uniref:Uncharacterized protein n=1 Tax=Mycena venus TaxID=2733690 RepID=A0A8H7CPZ1_9AGAR|nr:hypothetical protein MVEN_01608400 [Mycena venus]